MIAIAELNDNNDVKLGTSSPDASQPRNKRQEILKSKGVIARKEPVPYGKAEATGYRAVNAADA